jgi:hypothetical protein
MTALRDTVVRWVDQRIEAMLDALPMWGSPEAVELQVLLLLEVRALALRPDQTLAEPRRVLDTYIAHLAQRFPQGGSRPLHELITGDDEVCSKLAEELRRFDEILRWSGALALEHSTPDTATVTLVFGGEPVVQARAGAERARRMRMTEAEQDLPGVLLGVLPIARRFELRVEESGEIVDGRLTDEIEDLEALVGMRCVASLWVVTLARPGKEQRAYYLTGIRAAPAD